MKLKYLGTAASEGWPALFCNCRNCKLALEEGGKNIRTRSQGLLDDTILIDLPPDTYHHYLTHKFDLPNIEHLLITHSHSDHFYNMELTRRCPPYCGDNKKTLNIYGNDKVKAKYKEAVDFRSRIAPYVKFTQLENFKSYDVKGYIVTPITALHDRTENCLNYLITHENKTILYAHDTGIYEDEVWDFLADKNLDLVSLDCTTGYESDGKNHMGFVDTVTVKEKMIKEKIADKNTIFVLSHFSHNGRWSHLKLEEKAKEHGMLVAYDGMVVDF